MPERFKTVKCYYVDGKAMYSHDVYLNPFQVESFYSTSITDEDGEEVSTTHVHMKSGDCLDVFMDIEDFLKILE
jgi:hypothetical protein